MRGGKSPMHGKKVVRDVVKVGVDFVDVGAGDVKGDLVKDP